MDARIFQEFNRPQETYNYMDYLFTFQPGDKWIYKHMKEIDLSLKELESKGEWYDGCPPGDVMERNRFTFRVVKHTMYEILQLRLALIKNHLDVYKFNGQHSFWRCFG